MKLSVQRAIDRWVGQVLCWALSRWDALVRRPVRVVANRPRRLLVILLSEMGSVVLAQAMFDELQRAHPGAELHVLQLRKNQSVMRLLGYVPEQHLHSVDDSSLGRLLGSLWRTLATLRGLQLDGVIDCELFSRISALLSYGCGARVRVGFTPHTQEGLYRGNFMNAAVPYNPYQHISLQFLGLARVMGRALSNPEELGRLKPLNRLMLPHLQTSLRALPLDAAELETFKNRLLNDHPVLSRHPRRVLMYVSGGALPIRAWPESHYIELARQLLAHGCAVGLIGLPEDTPQAQRVLAALQHDACRDLTGYTRNLRELLMLFHHADLLITNDGGPGHFAGLTPIPSLMFFGPETSRLYGPISERATVLESGMACSPCLSAYNHRDSFCDGDNRCLQVIEPAQVLALALNRLAL
jgi:ADP-heptose:LPS heptosyltransferase